MIEIGRLIEIERLKEEERKCESNENYKKKKITTTRVIPRSARPLALEENFLRLLVEWGSDLASQ